MKALAFATIEQIKKLIENKEVSRREVAEYFVERFKKFDNEIGSALEIFDVDSILKYSEDNGILCGIPGLVKDNIAQKDRKLTCASKILEGFTSTYDSTASDRLKKEGALLIGRANMDEFAMGSSNETSAFKPCKNPWDLSRVSGGSSGGSIAAVSAGLVPWALGSETGGSVRQPAALCGIVGLKPTYGLVSRYGLVAYASSLDQIGIATRTVKDNAIVLSAIAGHDIKDSSSLAVDPQDYTQSLDGSLPKNLKIGVLDNALEAEGIDSEVKQKIEESIANFEKMGARVDRVKVPSIDYSAAAYFIISRAEAASNLARFDGVRYGYRDKNIKSLNAMYEDTRHDGFGSNVRSRILVGNYVLSAGHADEFYQSAKKVQNLIRSDFVNIFKDYDILISPVHPAPAFKFGAFDQDKLQMDLQDYFTCFVNLAGLPALSIPCGFSKENLPIGFQLIGPHLSEDLLYKIAYAYEKEHEWVDKVPEKFK